MKLLVATSRTQGARDSDFSFCVEGELVHFGFTCDLDADSPNPDGGCGCGRAFAGLNSHRGTTTAEVRDIDFTRRQFIEAIRSSLEQQGWDPDPGQAADEADELLVLASCWPVGTVLERRGDQIQERTP